MFRVPTRQRRASARLGLWTHWTSLPALTLHPLRRPFLLPQMMESDMDALSALAAARGGGAEISVPDKYVLSSYQATPDLKCPCLQWRGHSHLIARTIESAFKQRM